MGFQGGVRGSARSQLCDERMRRSNAPEGDFPRPFRAAHVGLNNHLRRAARREAVHETGNFISRDFKKKSSQPSHYQR